VKKIIKKSVHLVGFSHVYPINPSDQVLLVEWMDTEWASAINSE